MTPGALAPGVIVAGRYEIRAVIGAGTFGLVYRAWDRHEERHVAVKTLRPEALSIPEMVERFEREGDVCYALRHKYAVVLHDHGHFDDPGLPAPMPFT